MANFLNMAMKSARSLVASSALMYFPSAMAVFSLWSWPWLSFSSTSASSFRRFSSAVELAAAVSWAFCSMWAI